MIDEFDKPFNALETALEPCNTLDKQTTEPLNALTLELKPSSIFAGNSSAFNEPKTITDLTDSAVSNNLANQFKNVVNSEDNVQKSLDVADKATKASIETQSLAADKRIIDNKVTEHEINLEKHLLDIRYKHDEKMINDEKKSERRRKQDEIKTANSQSKLKYIETKYEPTINHNPKRPLKTRSGLLLFIISAFLGIADFCAGITEIFNGFNKIVKAIFWIGLAVAIFYLTPLHKIIQI